MGSVVALGNAHSKTGTTSTAGVECSAGGRRREEGHLWGRRRLRSAPCGRGLPRCDAEGLDRSSVESAADGDAGSGLKPAQRAVGLGAEPAIKGAGSKAELG